jgi:hypothetical protein
MTFQWTIFGLFAAVLALSCAEPIKLRIETQDVDSGIQERDSVSVDRSNAGEDIARTMETGVVADATASEDRTSTLDVAVSDVRIQCGGPGQPCCYGRGCLGGAQCISGACFPFTRYSMECLDESDCAPGSTCTGIFDCGGRSCFRCAPVDMTGSPVGSPCSPNSRCSRGVCFGGVCSLRCDFSRSEDACGSLGSQYRCFDVFGDGYTRGYCLRACTTNSSCSPAGVCTPLTTAGFVSSDEIGFYCDVVRGSQMDGQACANSQQCISGLCASSAGCTARCLTSADCPAALPSCTGRTTFTSPSGARFTISFCWRG